MKPIFKLSLSFVLLLSACATSLTNTKLENGLYPLSARTGVDDVDVVLSAFEGGEPQAIRDLMQFNAVPCTLADGLGGPPKCEENEIDGTVVNVFPFLGSEGSFLRSENIMNFPGVFTDGIYAAYQVGDVMFADDVYPKGEYAIALKGTNGAPDVIVRVSEGKIVRMDYVLGIPDLQEKVQAEAIDWLLKPASVK